MRLTRIEVNRPASSNLDLSEAANVAAGSVFADRSALLDNVIALKGSVNDALSTSTSGSSVQGGAVRSASEHGQVINAVKAPSAFSQDIDVSFSLSENLDEVSTGVDEDDPDGEGVARFVQGEFGILKMFDVDPSGGLDATPQQPLATVPIVDSFRTAITQADRETFIDLAGDALGDIALDASDPVFQRTEFTINENGVLTPTSVSLHVGDDAPVGLDLTNQNTPGVPFDGTAPTNPPSSETETSIRIDVNTDVANGATDIEELFGAATPRGGGPAEFMENLSFNGDGGRGALRGIVNLEGLQAAQALGLGQGIDPDLIQEAIRNYFNVSLGSAVIDIDLDLDGVSDIVITADGDFDTPEFRLEPTGDGAVAFSMYTGNTDAQGRVGIFGATVVEEVLEADITAVYDAEGIDETTVTYQWLRDGAAITGATGATHTLSSADIGGYLSVQVSFEDGFGNAESVSSQVTRAIVAQTTALTGTLGIVGDTGLFEFVRVTTDGLVDPDGMIAGSEQFQWFSNGQAIDGATAGQLFITRDLLGTNLTVQLQYFDGNGVLESITSSPRAVGGGILGTD